MENQINTGTLDALKPGQTLLESVIQVNGGKVQLQFAEKIDNGTQTTGNVLTMFNADDERFQRKARKAWLTAEMSNAEQLLGIDMSNLTFSPNEYGKPAAALNVLNPVINGERMRVQITETVVPQSQYDVENVDTRAKRRGKDGDFILHKGQYIFTINEIVLGEPKHTFLESDRVEEFSSIPANVDTSTGEIFN
jgi:hypothetical protein